MIETDILQELTGLAAQAGLRVRTVRGPAARSDANRSRSASNWLIVLTRSPALRRRKSDR